MIYRTKFETGSISSSHHKWSIWRILVLTNDLFIRMKETCCVRKGLAATTLTTAHGCPAGFHLRSCYLNYSPAHLEPYWTVHLMCACASVVWLCICCAPRAVLDCASVVWENGNLNRQNPTDIVLGVYLKENGVDVYRVNDLAGKRVLWC